MTDAGLTFVARTKSGVVQFVRRHNQARNRRVIMGMAGTIFWRRSAQLQATGTRPGRRALPPRELSARGML